MYQIRDTRQNSNVDAMWNEFRSDVCDIFATASITEHNLLKMHTCVLYACSRYEDRFASTSQESRLYKKVSAFLHNVVADIEEKSKDLQDQDLIAFYVQQWKNYTVSSNILSDIFAPMNRFWVKSKRLIDGYGSTYEIYQLALIEWRDSLLESLHERLTNAVMKLVARERLGAVVDTTLIRGVIDSYIELGRIRRSDDIDDDLLTQEERDIGVYRKFFENPLLETTERFYHGEDDLLTVFKQKVRQWLREEEELSRPATTKPQATPRTHINPTLVSGYLDILWSSEPRRLSYVHDD